MTLKTRCRPKSNRASKKRIPKRAEHAASFLFLEEGIPFRRTSCDHTSMTSLPSRSWHCFVGRNFACYVTYEEHSFIYFYIGQVGVCVFATG